MITQCYNDAPMPFKQIFFGGGQSGDPSAPPADAFEYVPKDAMQGGKSQQTLAGAPIGGIPAQGVQQPGIKLAGTDIGGIPETWRERFQEMQKKGGLDPKVQEAVTRLQMLEDMQGQDVQEPVVDMARGLRYDPKTGQAERIPGWENQNSEEMQYRREMDQKRMSLEERRLNAQLAAMGRHEEPRPEKPLYDSRLGGTVDVNTGIFKPLTTADGRPLPQISEDAPKPTFADLERKNEKERKYAGANQSAKENAERMIGLVEEARNMVKPSNTGVFSTLNVIPGTAGHDLEMLNETLRANASFESLQEMRNNSPTGGALGSVSDADMRLLQAKIANLSTSQSQKQYLNTLGEIEKFYRNILNGGKINSSNSRPNDMPPIPQGFELQ